MIGPVSILIHVLRSQRSSRAGIVGQINDGRQGLLCAAPNTLTPYSADNTCVTTDCAA